MPAAARVNLPQQAADVPLPAEARAKLLAYLGQPTATPALPPDLQQLLVGRLPAPPPRPEPPPGGRPPRRGARGLRRDDRALGHGGRRHGYLECARALPVGAGQRADATRRFPLRLELRRLRLLLRRATGGRLPRAEH